MTRFRWPLVWRSRLDSEIDRRLHCQFRWQEKQLAWQRAEAEVQCLRAEIAGLRAVPPADHPPDRPHPPPRKED